MMGEEETYMYINYIIIILAYSWGAHRNCKNSVSMLFSKLAVYRILSHTSHLLARGQKVRTALSLVRVERERRKAHSTGV